MIETRISRNDLFLSGVVARIGFYGRLRVMVNLFLWDLVTIWCDLAEIAMASLGTIEWTAHG